MPRGFLLKALTRLFHTQDDNRRHSVCWSRSAPAAVDERTTARAPWLHEVFGLAPPRLKTARQVVRQPAVTSLTRSPRPDPVGSCKRAFFGRKICSYPSEPKLQPMNRFIPTLAQSEPMSPEAQAGTAVFWVAVAGLLLAIYLRNKRRAEQAKAAPPPLNVTLPAGVLGDGQGPPLHTVGLEPHEVAAMRKRLLFPTYVVAGICVGLGLLWLGLSFGMENGSEMRWCALGVNALGGGMLVIALGRTKRLARDALRAECLVSDIGRLGVRKFGHARFPATFTFNFQGRRQVVRHQSVPKSFLVNAAQHEGKATIIVDGMNLQNVLSFEGEAEARAPSHHYMPRR